jgi:hypothetical protein
MVARWVAAAGALSIIALASPVSAQQPPPQQQPTEAPQQEAPPPRSALEQILIERGGLLLRPGQLEIEPTLEYGFFSTRRINVSGFSILPTLIIGVLETEKVERTVLDGALTLRLGIFRDFQVEARMRYGYIEDDLTTETTEVTRSNSGIGDVEAALSYQLFRERGLIPDMILSVRGRFPTGDDGFGGNPNKPALGSGFYGVQGSMTVVKAVDPAALFATALYSHNFSRTVRLQRGDQFETEITPGDSFGYQLGIGIGLTPELALNLRFEQRILFDTKTKEPGSSQRTVNGSGLNVATIFFGVYWSLTRHLSVDTSVGVGLTEDSPDFIVRLAFPIRFNVW